MGMTAYEQLAKKQIIKALAADGYPTYAKFIRDLFDINLTEDPDVVAYMEPSKARIVVNSGLDIDQVSTVVRHEILHEYLNHHRRLIKKLAQEANLDPDKLDDMSLKELENKLYSNQIFNIAGDYEISNRGYTQKDKSIVRSLILNGQICRGLVTEDDHPEWVNLSVEEMYDKLRQEMQQDDQMQPQSGGNQEDKDYDASEVKPSDNNSSSSQGQSGGGNKIIKGTFKNGKFYDLDGNEIKH